ncbi:MAG: glycosyltransferase family 1 protein [Patescibacteria group bacterium]
MKIGIDCRTILNPVEGERGGIGHYTYYLVKTIIESDKKNQYALYFDWRVKDTREFERPNVEIKHFPFSQYNSYLPFAYSHMLIAAYLMKESLDVYHSPVASLPFTYPKKSVITVHDLAMYKNPSWYPSQIITSKLLVPQSLRKADKIIAVSESTKRDLKSIFNINAKKIAVIHEGAVVDKIPVKNKKIDSISKYQLGNGFFLFIGTLAPRKNVVTLVRAYKKLLEWDSEFSAYPLVIAGSKDFRHEDVFNTIKELKITKQVKYLGYVTHNQKIELLKKATAFVFPSLYEGFGLPVLEAMTCGTPVITSRASSLPEVAGRAALLVDPLKELEIAKAMRRLLENTDLRKRLETLGYAQAKKFSWQSCAAQTIQVYQSLSKK